MAYINSDPTLPPYVTLLAFNLRFTQEERLAVRAAQQTNPVVDDIFYLMGLARYIDFSTAMVQNGLQYLEAAGILAFGRADEIMNAPIQQSERPPMPW